MVVESLSHQLQCQWIRCSAGFLQLGTLVLKPDFDLRLVKSEFGCQPLTTLFGEVSAGVKLSSQHGQLVAVESRPRSFVVRAGGAAVARRGAAGCRTARRVALSAS